MVTSQTHDVNRVMRILDRLVKANKDIFEIRDVKWNLTLIDDPQVNASAFPVSIHFYFSIFALKNKFTRLVN